MKGYHSFVHQLLRASFSSPSISKTTMQSFQNGVQYTYFHFAISDHVTTFHKGLFSEIWLKVEEHE